MYAYNLGFCAFHLASSKLSGYMCTINNLKAPVTEWSASGVPLTALLELDEKRLEQEQESLSPLHSPMILKKTLSQQALLSAAAAASVSTSFSTSTPTVEGTAFIAKAQVDLRGPAYSAYLKIRAASQLFDLYENPGPIQVSYKICHTRRIKWGERNKR